MADPADEDLDEVDREEREGREVRRGILAGLAAERVDAQAIGKVLAELTKSKDDHVRLGAVDKVIRLTGAEPNRRKRVKVTSDQRSVVAVLGHGALAAPVALDEERLKRLPPAERRKAIEAMDTLRRLEAPAEPAAKEGHDGA